MRSMIIFALVVVVCAALSEARHTYKKREVAADDAILVAQQGKDKGSKERLNSKEDIKENEEKHDHSKEHEKEDRHDHSKKEHEPEHGHEIADSSEVSDDFSENDFVAIIAIIIDPVTRRARMLSHELPPAEAAALL